MADESHSSKTIEDFLHLEGGLLWACVSVGVATVVGGAVASSWVLSHARVGNAPISSDLLLPNTAMTTLLKSHVTAGLLHIGIFTPILLATLLLDKESQDKLGWACSVGWGAWIWAWVAQAVGVVALSYERFKAVTTPLRGRLSTHTGCLLAGMSWASGGVTMVMVIVVVIVNESPITHSPYNPTSLHNTELMMNLMIYLILPSQVLLCVILGWLWTRTISTAMKQKTKMTEEGECGLLSDKDHEGESSTPYLSTPTFTPNWCAPQPNDRLQAVLCSTTQCAAALLLTAPRAHTDSDTPMTENRAGCGGTPADWSGGGNTLTISPNCPRRNSLFRCPSPTVSCHGQEEDTFTLGGVYIGTLESHIRTHGAFCTSLNVRSQSCQTGDDEVSPPVVEFRVLPPTPTLQLTPTTFDPSDLTSTVSVGIQCTGLKGSPGLSPSVAKALCLHSTWSRARAICQVEMQQAQAVALMIVVQVGWWLPLPFVALTCHLLASPPLITGQVLFTALTLTGLAPALAPASYLALATKTTCFFKALFHQS